MSRDDTRFTDIDRLAGSVPDRVISQLRRRGIVTCEQAYEAVWRLRDKADEADTDLTTAETIALLAAIEKILPMTRSRTFRKRRRHSGRRPTRRVCYRRRTRIPTRAKAAITAMKWISTKTIWMTCDNVPETPNRYRSNNRGSRRRSRISLASQDQS